MNRKQRRALGRSGAGSGAGPAAATTPGDTLAKMFAAAVAHHRAGELIEAERHYRHILAFAPDHAELQSRMGAVLMAQGKTEQAISHLERAVALDPDLFEALGNLAQVYLATGQSAHA